jgi:hypothetical protein
MYQNSSPIREHQRKVSRLLVNYLLLAHGLEEGDTRAEVEDIAAYIFEPMIQMEKNIETLDRRIANLSRELEFRS